MNHENGTLSLIKAFLTKACFTVGLCTTAYWSVAKIHQTMYPSKADLTATSEGQTLRDKADAISQQQNLGTVPEAHFAAHPLNHIVPVTPAVVAPASSPAATEAPAVVATESASPSPNPGDAQAQGQEANNGELPVAEPFYPNPYAYHQAMMDLVREEVARDTAARSGSDSASASASPADANGVGSTGQLIKPTGGGQVYGGINIAAGGNTINVTSNLSQQDITWLLSANVKATIPSASIPVTAKKLDGTVVDNATVASNRWDLSNGVKPDATFAVRASSGGYPVQFEVTLNLETQNSIAKPVQFTVRPTDSKAKNDVVNGRPVRVYTFSAPELTLLANTSNSEAVKQVAVRLVFEINNGTPVLIDGGLGFQRAGIKTAASAWDPARSPAEVVDPMIVDQLPFSMKLEKSQ